MAKISLTPPQQKFAERVLWHVWETIASDLFSANEHRPMKRVDVVEVCFDANRPSFEIDHSSHLRARADPDDVRIVRDWFDDYDKGAEHDALGLIVFPHGSYVP